MSQKAQNVIAYILIVAVFSLVAFKLNGTVQDFCKSAQQNSIRTNQFIDTLVKATLEFGKGSDQEVAARAKAYEQSKDVVHSC